MGGHCHQQGPALSGGPSDAEASAATEKAADEPAPGSAVDDAPLWVWIAFPLAGLVWLAMDYRSSWYHFDEWSMIDRAGGGWSGLLEGHQGHLEIQNYLVYRIQRSWFGLESRQLVYLGFATSVAALQVSVSVLLRRLGLPDLLALLAGGMIAFFGPGAQNAVFEFQQGINFAIALCLFAAFVALREDRTTKGAVTVAGLLLLAVATDSGLAAVGAVYVGLLVVLLWPRRLFLVALGAPAAASVAWQLLGEQPPGLTTPWGSIRPFVEHLLSLGAAGLAGGGERYLPGLPDQPPAYPLTTTETAVAVAFLVAGCIALGARFLNRAVVASLVAGSTAAVFCAVAIARERALYVEPARLPGSRYVQWVALFLLLAVAPALAAVMTGTTARGRRAVTIVAASALVVVFIVNLTSLHSFQEGNERNGDQARQRVAETIDLIERGCGRWGELDPEAEAMPLLTVGVVQELLREGALNGDLAEPAPSELRSLLCRTA